MNSLFENVTRGVRVGRTCQGDIGISDRVSRQLCHYLIADRAVVIVAVGAQVFRRQVQVKLGRAGVRPEVERRAKRTRNPPDDALLQLVFVLGDIDRCGTVLGVRIYFSTSSWVGVRYEPCLMDTVLTNAVAALDRW